MKKLISAFLAAATLAGGCVVGASAADFHFEEDDTYQLGDVDCDGERDALDSFAMHLYLAGVADPDVQFNVDAADLDADGEITAYDSLLLSKCIAKNNYDEFESSAAIYRMTIADNDIRTYNVVVPEGTDSREDNVYYAADLMRKFITVATGYNPLICYGKPDKENGIYFHAVDEDSELGQELGVEGYVYEVVDGQIHVYGTRRGNMYAVSEIAETYLGYRFYHEDYTLVYTQRSADIPEGAYSKKIPLLNFRYARPDSSTYEATTFYFPNRLNGMQVNGYDQAYYGTKTGPLFLNAHSFGWYWAVATAPEGEYKDIWARQKAGEQKNEYQWQPCFTSDSDYEKLFFGMLTTIQMRNFTFESGTYCMSFSICDNVKYCMCADCSTIYATDGYAGGSVYIANRAVEDARQYYPGIKLYFIVYDHTIPHDIIPDEDLIIMYCGNGCNNHYLGSGECGDNVTALGGSNKADEIALKGWGDICQATGAQLWFWYYPVTYHYLLGPCPNILNIYYDLKFAIEECNVTGIYYEGGGCSYNFEQLKGYLATKLMWEPDMTEEEFFANMKEFLYLYYGNGYEELFQYILLQDEAGNQAGCFINNHDLPGDMYSAEYLAEHYEEMRNLLLAARDKAKNDTQVERVNLLLASCEFLGLSASYDQMYKNGTAESKALYMERYDWMYNFIKTCPAYKVDVEDDYHNHYTRIKIYGTTNGKNGEDIDFIYTLPAKISYDESPIIQFYEEGAYTPGMWS